MTAKKISLEVSDSSGNAQDQELDIKDLSDEDLMSLQQEDPFMYYSIPGIRRAAILGQDIDPSDKDSLCSQYHERRESGFSVESDSSSGSNRSGTTVTRQTRISFESDACSLINMMEGYDDTNENVTRDDENEEFGLLNFLEKIDRI